MKSKRKVIKTILMIVLSITMGASSVMMLSAEENRQEETLTSVIPNSSGYIFEDEYKTVSNIKEGTTISEFKESFDTYVVKIYQNEVELQEGIVEKEMIVRLEKEDFVAEYRVTNEEPKPYVQKIDLLQRATLGISGSQWMQGNGVNVYLGGGVYQCVELAARLYATKGWPKVYAGGNGGAQYIPEGSSGLQQYRAGSGYVPVPGDLVIEYAGIYNSPWGHVAVVDYTDINTGVIHAVEQNGLVQYGGRTKYYYNGSNYQAQAGWGSGGIKMILHAPQNTLKNPGTVPPNPPAVVKDIKVTNESSTGYTVTVSLDNAATATSIDFVSWPKRYDNKKVRHNIPTNGKSEVSFNVNVNEHNNETGTYNTDITVYQKGHDPLQGSKLPKNGRVKGIIPELKNLHYTDVDSTGFTINADVVKSGKIKEVELYIWTQSTTQEDLRRPIVKIVDDKLSYRVKREDFKNKYGAYSTHLYIRDIYGEETVLQISKFNPQIPAITDVKITDEDSSGYTVSGTIYDPATIQKKIDILVWKEGANGTQIGLKKTPAIINGNKFTYRVNTSDHNYEVGKYRTHIYAYDLNGTVINYSVPETPNLTVPSFSNVEFINVDSTGFTIKAKIENYEEGSSAKAMVWTEYNGQDDLRTYPLIIKDGYIEHRVNRSDHRGEYGVYRTHLFIKGKNPKQETKLSLENVIVPENK